MLSRSNRLFSNTSFIRNKATAPYNSPIFQRLRMNLPIRIRLSISYFLIFLAAGILLCCASYLMARRSLYIALDHELEEHIDDVHDFLAAHSLAGDTARAIAVVSTEYPLKDDGKWLQIKNQNGQWIYRARRMMIAPHDLPLASALPSTGSILEFNADDKQVRSMRKVIEVDGHTFVVEEGATLTKTDRTLLLFRNGLFLISPVIFVIAGLAGHLLSRRALDPVAAIAREAQRIHDGNLQVRLPQLKTRDELAHLSATLNDMLERIESAVSSVRDFISYASHELRTPVALIRTEADLALQFERTSPEYREAIGIIGLEAQRMSSLLDSLLFLARADAGAEQVRLEPVDARRICRQACEKWRPLFAKSGLQLRADFAEKSLIVMADNLYLQRLLNILLENAWKYTPRDGMVSLMLQQCEDRVRFSLTDTGIGIPLKDQPFIFERFRRASNVQESEAHGSGLGLALASWIARRHQTEIQVDSIPGTGSTFAFELPAVHETENSFVVAVESGGSSAQLGRCAP
jgi:signal transduction histidine kinase